MKKIMALVMAALTVAALASCTAAQEKNSVSAETKAAAPAATQAAVKTTAPAATQTAKTAEATEEADGNIGEQIANPFTECKNADEAESAAGFAMTVPEKLPAGFSLNVIEAIKGEMIQYIYENGDKQLTLRKGTGGDISGDYNEYSEKTTVSLGGRQITEKGDGGRIYVAIWSDGGFSYSVTADGGLSGAEMLALASAMK